MQFRPCSQGNTIVPFHLRSTFWNAKSRLFTQEWNNRILVFVSVHTGTQSFLSTVFSLPFFPATTTFTHALRAKILSFRFWNSLAPHCLFTREQNGKIAYHSTFRITYFIVPFFGTERYYFKRSCVNATPERSTFRNGTIWNGTIAFPCEQGLNCNNVLH